MHKDCDQPIGLKTACKIVDSLSSTAGKVSNEAVKKILLQAGCDIADLAIQTQLGTPLAKAA